MDEADLNSAHRAIPLKHQHTFMSFMVSTQFKSPLVLACFQVLPSRARNSIRKCIHDGKICFINRTCLALYSFPGLSYKPVDIKRHFRFFVFRKCTQDILSCEPFDFFHSRFLWIKHLISLFSIPPKIMLLYFIYCHCNASIFMECGERV